MNTSLPRSSGSVCSCSFSVQIPRFRRFWYFRVVLLGVFFISQHIYGLAGSSHSFLRTWYYFSAHRTLRHLIFASVASPASGSLLWAMLKHVREPITISPDLLLSQSLISSSAFQSPSRAFYYHAFHGSWMSASLSAEAAGGDSQTLRAERSPVGSTGTAITDLFPSRVDRRPSL